MRRTILITGAGSGIGAALARRLAAPEIALLLHSRGGDAAGRSRLEAVAQSCRDASAATRIATGDLAEPGVGAEAVALALESFGRLDQIVHNAGFADKRPFAELERGHLEASLAAMPCAFLEVVKAALPALAASPCGRVVAVSSFVAHRYEAGRLFPASAAAKSALEALARSLAVELGGSGATVNIVVPGYTRKDEGKLGALAKDAWAKVASLNPQKRLASQDDIASAIAFLLSDAASHITGATLPVDGGLTIG